MRKRVFLAMLMIAAIVLTTSCSLIVKDSAVDAQTVIIEVAGKSITKAEVQAATQNTLSYQQYMYSMYGLPYDPTDAKTMAQAQDSAIEALIQSAVLDQKINEGGYNTFTQEELTAIEASAQASYDSNVEHIMTTELAGTTLTGEALDAAVAQQMTEHGYQDMETLISSAKFTKAQEKLKADLVKDVTVSDEEIQTAYDQNVATAQSNYAASLSQYGTDVSNGTTVYYRPAGYRQVKNILRKFTDADAAIITDLASQITAKQGELDTNAASLTALPADAATDTAEQAESRASLTADKATLETALVDLNAQLTAAKAKAAAAIQPTVDEITAKLAAGEDFDALMAEYGEDTGMQAEPAKTEGYLVCEGSTQWVAEFTAASMALAKIGDVSAPFETQYGIHIVKYVGDVAEGAVPLADVQDAIRAELLTTKQDTLYTDTLAQWAAAANATINKAGLN